MPQESEDSIPERSIPLDQASPEEKEGSSESLCAEVLVGIAGLKSMAKGESKLGRVIGHTRHSMDWVLHEGVLKGRRQAKLLKQVNKASKKGHSIHESGKVSQSSESEWESGNRASLAVTLSSHGFVTSI